MIVLTIPLGEMPIREKRTDDVKYIKKIVKQLEEIFPNYKVSSQYNSFLVRYEIKIYPESDMRVM